MSMIKSESTMTFNVLNAVLGTNAAGRKFGYNPAAGTTPETIWDGGGLYSYPTVADTVTVVSDDAKDDINAGVGARTIKVYGLDVNYEKVTETLEMDGVTPVIGEVEFLRVYRVVVKTVGSEGDNAGTIDIDHTTSEDLLARILPGNGQTLMCVYTVPKNKILLIVSGSAGVGKGHDALIQSMARPIGEGFQVKNIRALYQNSQGQAHPVPFVFDEKTDIEMRASTSVGTVAVASDFNFYEIDKTAFPNNVISRGIGLPTN